MHMLWHEDKREQFVAMSTHRCIDGVGQQLTSSLGSKKWKSAVARERQLVGVAW